MVGNFTEFVENPNCSPDDFPVKTHESHSTVPFYILKRRTVTVLRRVIYGISETRSFTGTHNFFRGL